MSLRRLKTSHGGSSLGSFLPEHRRHAPDDPPDARHALPQRPRLPDEVDQPVEHQQDAVVRLCRGHLEEAAALRQRQLMALLAGDAAAVLQVPLVPHHDDGHRRHLPAAADQLQLLADGLEAVAVADVVDQHHPVRPLQLLVAEGAAFPTGLERNHTFGSDVYSSALQVRCSLPTREQVRTYLGVPDVDADLLTVDSVHSTVNGL